MTLSTKDLLDIQYFAEYEDVSVNEAIIRKNVGDDLVGELLKARELLQDILRHETSPEIRQDIKDFLDPPPPPPPRRDRPKIGKVSNRFTKAAARKRNG